MSDTPTDNPTPAGEPLVTHANVTAYLLALHALRERRGSDDVLAVEKLAIEMSGISGLSTTRCPPIALTLLNFCVLRWFTTRSCFLTGRRIPPPFAKRSAWWPPATDRLHLPDSRLQVSADQQGLAGSPARRKRRGGHAAAGAKRRSNCELTQRRTQAPWRVRLSLRIFRGEHEYEYHS